MSDTPPQTSQAPAAKTFTLLCTNCTWPNKFRGEAALEKHLALVHYECQPYSCDECHGFAKFHNERALRDHYESEHVVGKYTINYKATDAELFKRSQIAKCMKMAVDEARLKAEQGERDDAEVISSAIVVNVSGSKRAFKAEPPLNLSTPNSNRQSAPSVPNTANGINNENFIRELFSNARARMSGQAGSSPSQTEPHSSTSTPLATAGAKPLLGRKVSLKAACKCNKCGDMVPNMKHSLGAHINNKHLKLSTYRCTICERDFTSYIPGPVGRHMSVHLNNGQAGNFVRKEAAFQRIDHAVEKYFK